MNWEGNRSRAALGEGQNSTCELLLRQGGERMLHAIGMV